MNTANEIINSSTAACNTDNQTEAIIQNNESYMLLEYYLKQLRLPSFLQNHTKVAKLATEQNHSYSNYLERLAEIEVTDRSNRSIKERIRKAHFPYLKTLDGFDFSKVPTLNKKLVCELAKCDYINKKENIIAIGNSGMGKTHLAIALGMLACQQGFRVGYYSTAALTLSLLEAYDEKKFLKMKQKIFTYDLLILDELGYVPLSKTGSELLFDVFAQIYEQRSVIITTNLPFTQWTSIFGCEHLTGALIDRLTHHVHILQMTGTSYRLDQSKSNIAQESKNEN